MSWIIARLKERSTWLGITGLLTAVGVGLSPETAEAIVTAGVAIAGVIAMFTKDSQPPAP